MDLIKIKQVVDLMKKSDLSEFEIQDQDFKLRIKRDLPGRAPIAAQAAPVAAAPAPVAPAPGGKVGQHASPAVQLGVERRQPIHDAGGGDRSSPPPRARAARLAASREPRFVGRVLRSQCHWGRARLRAGSRYQHPAPLRSPPQ